MFRGACSAIAHVAETVVPCRGVQHAFAWSKLSYIQPDALNCGGITGWLRVAELSRKTGIPVCRNCMQELHVRLVAGQPNARWVDTHSFDIDLSRPPQLAGAAGSRPGRTRRWRPL
ncbi:enolase C-terminal domain-like protein [Mesorhizobium sp. J8]|uniref:enolase C-terminal domain-like protein n=1 Tax=Mesorhizobium sp. J8 TaxID=2777475 RepID=UPI001CD8A099|nr:enolase C-terminal domain-like protein [Mesorhizobium sp. J8]